MTVSQWVRGSWLPVTRGRVKATTFASYRRNLEIHVLPALGDRALADLTPIMLESLYGSLRLGGRSDRPTLSAKTDVYIRRTVRKLLQDAVDAGLLSRICHA
jgi:Phage integrase, N-terminal SAM-like domain